MPEYVSQMVHSGVLLVIPGTEDPRCADLVAWHKWWGLFDGVEYHVDDCGCGFVASPHPDIQRWGEQR